MGKPHTLQQKSYNAVVGVNIKFLRHRNKMTMTDVANKIGVRWQQVYKYETGANQLCLYRANQIANLFEIKLNELSDQYAASAASIAAIAGEGNNFGPEMEKLSSNISALNNTYELQLKSSNEYLASMSNMQELQDSIKSVMSDLAASAGDTQAYRENMATLSQNLSDLNNVYGNMLKAMRS